MPGSVFDAQLDVDLDLSEARRELLQLIDATETQLTRHSRTRPNFPAGAAGRDFADRGAALASMFEQVHEKIHARMAHTLAVAESGIAEVHTLQNTDEQTSRNFGEVG